MKSFLSSCKICSLLLRYCLTLIPYPGAIFVRTILLSPLRVEISFCKKNILKFLENLAEDFWKIWLKIFEIG